MKYAIVESGGKQFKAVEGSMIEVDRLAMAPGSSVRLEQVLLLVDEGSVTVGKPLIKDTPVWTTVIEHFKGPKVVIFNYRPKKRIRVKTGHRQNYTRLLVEQIGGTSLAPKKEPAKEAPAEVEEEVRGKKSAAAAPKGKAKAEPGQPAASPEEVVTKQVTPASKVKAVPKKSAGAEKKPVTPSQKGKAAPAKPAAKKAAVKKTAAKKPSGKSSAK